MNTVQYPCHHEWTYSHTGPPVPGDYRYRVANMGACSANRFGPCEVCQRECTTVNLQIEQRFYRHFNQDGSVRSDGWTEHKCRSLFGHLQCLLQSRRTPVNPNAGADLGAGI